MPRSHQAVPRPRFCVDADGKRLGGPAAIRHGPCNQSGDRREVDANLTREVSHLSCAARAHLRPGVSSPISDRTASLVRPGGDDLATGLPPSRRAATGTVPLIGEPVPDDRTAVRTDPLSVLPLGAVPGVGSERLPAGSVGTARATGHRHLLCEIRRLSWHTSQARRPGGDAEIKSPTDPSGPRTQQSWRFYVSRAHTHGPTTVTDPLGPPSVKA